MHRIHTKINNFTLPQINPAVCGFDDTRVSTTAQYCCNDSRNLWIREAIMRLLRFLEPSSIDFVN